MRNMIRTSMLIFAMFMSPVMGFGQNAPQKVAKVDSVKQVETVVPIHESLTAELAPSMVGNDTILSSIQDTLNQIAIHTTPFRFLGFEATRTNSWVGFVAMIVGVLAALFALLGYVYQKKSAKSLKNMQPHGLPFSILADRMFNSSIVLDILVEIEESNVSEKIKQSRRSGYETDKLLEEMKLPDDLIDLACYRTRSTFEHAFSVKLKWRDFNSLVDTAKLNYINGQYNELAASYRLLQEEIKQIFINLSNFEDAVLITSLSKKIRYSQFFSSREKFTIDYLFSNIFEFGFDFDARSLANPRIFKNYNKLLDYGVFFPKITPELKGEKNCTFTEKILLFLKKITKKKGEEFLLLEMRTSRMSASDKYIFNKFYFWFDGIKEYGEKDPLAAWRNTLGSEMFENLFLRWFDTYFHDEKEGDKINVAFIMRVIYADVIARKRKKMIEWKKDFYEQEKFYFKEKQKEYDKYGFFYSKGTCSGDIELSFYDFLSAIVAEQTIDISVSYLCSWLYELKDESEQSELFNGWTMSPLLEKIGIANQKRVLIKSKEELDEKLCNYTNEVLNYRLYPLPSTESFIEWVQANFDVFPFVKDADGDVD